MARVFIRDVYALDGVKRFANGGSKQFRVIGVVFTFYSDNRADALAEIVEERMERETPERYWADAREYEEVESSDARGLGFYRVETLVDEARPQRTDVRYRR